MVDYYLKYESMNYGGLWCGPLHIIVSFEIKYVPENALQSIESYIFKSSDLNQRKLISKYEHSIIKYVCFSK